MCSGNPRGVSIILVFFLADGILLASSCCLLYAQAGRCTCIVVRLFHFLVVVSSGLSLPPRHLDGDLDDCSSVIVPLDGGHFNHPVQIISEVTGGGEGDPEGLYVEGLGKRLLDGLIDLEP